MDRMAMPPVLVGIAPAQEGHEGQPLSPISPRAAGRALMNMTGLMRTQYLKAFDRVNVCAKPQTSTIFPNHYKAEAANLMGSLLRWRRVVFLGPNVAECFGVKRDRYDWFQWHTLTSEYHGLAGWTWGHALPCYWAVMPHPSGRNRVWNEPGMKEMAQIFLKELIDASATDTASHEGTG